MKTLIKLTQTTFFWNVLNGTITLITTELTGLGLEYAPFILAILSLVTKELNRRYNPYFTSITKEKNGEYNSESI